MCSYLDKRLIITPWVEEFTRGRAETLPDTNFCLTTFKMWDKELKPALDKRLLNTGASTEAPLNVYVFDIPDTHKYLNDNADNILEALANTE